LIAIDRAREIVSEMTANTSAPLVAPSFILRIVALISAIGFIATTLGVVELMKIDGGKSPISLFFGLGGFAALVMICHYLLRMIGPSAKTGANMPAQPASQAPPAMSGATNRALGKSPVPHHSIIEEPTQQFETERRAK
jgi:hypothetical protein